MGNLVSSDGLKPDPKKIEAIMNMPNDKAMESLRAVLTGKEALAFYDVNEPVTTQAYASIAVGTWS